MIKTIVEGTKRYEREKYMKKQIKNQVLRAPYFCRIREITEKESILTSQPINVGIESER